MTNLKEKGKNVLDKALGEIVPPIVNTLDVDGIVQQVDINEVVQKIDINALLDKVDINALLVKVDIDALIERSNLEAIVAQSSSGVFTGIMDTLRFQIVRVDLFLLKTFQFGKAILPPAPGMVDTRAPIPKTKIQKAVAVQLHYCGIFSKGLAFGFDASLLFFVQSVFTLAVNAALKRVNKLLVRWDPDEDALEENEFIASSILNVLSAFSYFWIAIALVGQTIGMALVGIRVVNVNGDKDVTISRAALRTLGLLGTVFAWPFTMLVGVYRRDGRMPHDLLARTGVIFKWNARMARLREKNIDDDSTESSQGSMNVQQGSNADSESNASNVSESESTTSNAVEQSPDKATNESVPTADAARAAEQRKGGGTNESPRSNKSIPPCLVPDMSRTEKRRRTVSRVATVPARKGSLTNVPRTIVLSPDPLEDDSEKSTLSAVAPLSEKTVVSVSVPPSGSRLRQVLDEGRSDLQNVKPSGLVGFFLIRSVV